MPTLCARDKSLQRELLSHAPEGLLCQQLLRQAPLLTPYLGVGVGEEHQPPPAEIPASLPIKSAYFHVLRSLTSNIFFKVPETKNSRTNVKSCSTERSRNLSLQAVGAQGAQAGRRRSTQLWKSDPASGGTFADATSARPSHRPRAPAGGDRLKGTVSHSASWPFIQIRYFSVMHFSPVDPGARPGRAGPRSPSRGAGCPPGTT